VKEGEGQINKGEYEGGQVEWEGKVGRTRMIEGGMGAGDRNRVIDRENVVWPAQIGRIKKAD
jgi:hypothetical protein